MKRGKPTQGVGSPNEPSLDDESGVKAGLSRRHTHRGLGDGQAPKLVTMHGVAPPSDPPPPPSAQQAASGQNIGQRADELPLSALRPQGLPHFDGDDTPDEGEFAPLSNQLTTPGDRSQFRTAPGGGKNRVSGGRAAASAYVSPSTLAPGHGAEPKVQSVEVDSRVIREARFHQTEPSLVRRRASQVPPEPTEVPMKKSSWVLPALLALGAAVGVTLVMVLLLQPSDQSPAQKTAQGQSDASAAALSAEATNARNASLERPTTRHADSPSQGPVPVSPSATADPARSTADAPQSTADPARSTADPARSTADPARSTAASDQSGVAPKPATAAPKSTASPKSTAASKPSAAPKPATAPSRDLWIE